MSSEKDLGTVITGIDLNRPSSVFEFSVNTKNDRQEHFSKPIPAGYLLLIESISVITGNEAQIFKTGDSSRTEICHIVHSLNPVGSPERSAIKTVSSRFYVSGGEKIGVSQGSLGNTLEIYISGLLYKIG